jgi:hypothetical protein
MNSWIDAKRVVAAEPGPRDSFVVVLADGKRIETATVDRYEEVLIRSQRLARQTDLAVKVLPMTAREYIAFAGITAADLASTPEAEADLRQLAVEALKAAMVEAPDLTTRTEARDVLRAMGEVA